MSGHSKWSQIKHQKGVTDRKRGQTFTKLSNAITIAVKEGGGIADLIEKARSANMPKVNIDRAIERGLGKSEDTKIEEVTYEGFGPGRVAILISSATDNRKRTIANLKNMFNEFGGSLSGPGSTAYMFEYCGIICVKKESHSDDNLIGVALEVGCLDVKIIGDRVLLYVDPQAVHSIKELLSKKGFEIIDAQLSFRPKTTVKIEDKETQKKVLELIAKLKDNDDVQKVSSNLYID